MQLNQCEGSMARFSKVLGFHRSYGGQQKPLDCSICLKKMYTGLLKVAKCFKTLNNLKET